MVLSETEGVMFVEWMRGVKGGVQPRTARRLGAVGSGKGEITPFCLASGYIGTVG